MRSFILAIVLAAASPAHTQQPPADALETLLAAPKFEPSLLYTGADTPEDKPLLTAIINQAIRDIQLMPQPRDPARTRARLAALISDVENFATEDRREAYRYCVRIWRAAGFTQPSQLFEASDAEVLLFF